MSDDFMTRWSRRKRDVAEAERTKSATPEDAPPAPDEGSIKPAEVIEPTKSSEPGFDLKDLPPIDSITAATDIRPFPAPGVPVDIARAALRRAWTADSRIRDFVGLADYDWDYHATGTAGGFGPLEMTDELRRMVARIVGEIVGTDDTSDRAGEPAGEECAEESRPAGPEPKRLVPRDGEPVDLPPDHLGPAIPVEPTATVSAALQHQTSQDQPFRSPIRRGHGRALPK